MQAKPNNEHSMWPLKVTKLQPSSKKLSPDWFRIYASRFWISLHNIRAAQFSHLQMHNTECKCIYTEIPACYLLQVSASAFASLFLDLQHHCHINICHLNIWNYVRFNFLHNYFSSIEFKTFKCHMKSYLLWRSYVSSLFSSYTIFSFLLRNQFHLVCNHFSTSFSEQLT